MQNGHAHTRHSTHEGILFLQAQSDRTLPRPHRRLPPPSPRSNALRSRDSNSVNVSFGSKANEERVAAA